VGEDGIIVRQVRQTRRKKVAGVLSYQFGLAELEIYISLFVSIFQVPTALPRLREENYTTIVFF
jgi:hypothetical protein